MDSRAFARDLVRRSHTWAQEYVAGEYGRIRARIRGGGLIEWCRSFMWREYMVGVHVCAKTLALLPDEDQDLKLLLTTQILEEWKHSQIFAERARALGGEGDLRTYTPTAGDWELYHWTYRWGHPAELATALQCTGEVMITAMFRLLVDPRRVLVEEGTAHAIRAGILREGEVLESLVDAETARRLDEEVIPDEGQHIRFGRMILERHATTDEVQQMVLRVQQEKMAALRVSHGDLVDRVLGLQG